MQLGVIWVNNVANKVSPNKSDPRIEQGIMQEGKRCQASPLVLFCVSSLPFLQVSQCWISWALIDMRAVKWASHPGQWQWNACNSVTTVTGCCGFECFQSMFECLDLGEKGNCISGGDGQPAPMYWFEESLWKWVAKLCFWDFPDKVGTGLSAVFTSTGGCDIFYNWCSSASR